MPDFLLHVPQQPPRVLASGSKALRIGRTPDQDIVLDDPLVSRTHARLFWREGGLFVEDLGSKHGTCVNGTRIRAAHPLSPRDEVALGGAILRLEGVFEPEEGWAEETLALPVVALRSWIKSGTDRFPDWREALDLLHGVSLHLLQELPSEVFLEDLLDRLFRFLDASRGAVLLRNEAGELALLNFRTKEKASGAPLSLSPATVEAALERREALLLKEPRTQQPGTGLAPAESVTSTVMAVPLEHSGEVLGLFYFDASRARAPFTEDDLRFVASLGNLAAAKILQLRMAEELRRRQDLERELQAAEAAAKAKSEFLAHMSHEIRTPMNAILGFTHLALKETQTPKAADCLRKIDHSSRSLMIILNDILDVSKMEAGKLALEAIPYRLRPVLEDTLDLFRERAEEKGLELRIAMAEDLPEVLVGDPLRLGQVLINLVSNAVKFTERGAVALDAETLEQADGRALLRVSVRDTGIGLAAAEIGRLFTDFTQADVSTTRRYGGTGLGLAICRRLVDLMGGSIQVASEPGAGSTFSFTAWFPIGIVPVEGSEDLPAKPASRKGGTGRRVLLVEDNALNRELASILLEDAGIQVDMASDGFEALARVEEGSYDAVLMDVEMPGLDGLEATRRIRAAGGRFPIIAMTAHTLAGHRNLCLAAGMNDVLAKPIDPEHFLRMLEAWLVPTGPGGAEGLEGVMDVSRALGLLGGRWDLLKHFLAAFLEDPANPASIREALAAGDRDAAYVRAHNLKGMAGSLAIPAVAEAAGDLETWLQSGESEGWEPLCDRLAEAMACVRVFAGRVLGSTRP